MKRPKQRKDKRLTKVQIQYEKKRGTFKPGTKKMTATELAALYLAGECPKPKGKKVYEAIQKLRAEKNG